MHGLEDGLLLAASGVFLAMLALLLWFLPGGGQPRRVWPGIAVVCGVAFLAGARPAFIKLAQYEYEARFDQMIDRWGSLTSHRRPPGWLGNLHDFIQDRGHQPPEWLVKQVRKERVTHHTHPAVLLQSSRPAARLAMADSMFMFAHRPRYLMQEWRTYFPAITGQDVELAMRNGWLPRLDAIRTNPTSRPEATCVATFFIGLIVLSDSDSFANWRVPVRDGMLHGEMPGWSDYRCAAYWWRMLDLLLAADPPAEWRQLAEPVIADPLKLYWAERLPLRGVAGTFPEFHETGVAPQNVHRLEHHRSSTDASQAEAVSPETTLRPEQWLALAWARQHSDGEHAAPPHLEAAMEGLLRFLEAADMSSYQAFSRDFHNNLMGRAGDPAERDPDAANLHSFMIRNSFQRVRDTKAMTSAIRRHLFKIGLMHAGDMDIETLKATLHPQAIFKAIRREDHAFWASSFGNPDDAARMVLACLDRPDKQNQEWLLNSMIEAIEARPPDADVIDAVWRTLRSEARHAHNRNEAWGALFRLARFVSDDERTAMRRDALDHQSYQAPGFTDLLFWDHNPEPLFTAGGGLGIPWEDDALSARYSWFTNLERQFHPSPRDPSGDAMQSEVFRFLAQGDEISDDHGPRRGVRPHAPFPPTPWQLARALHQRRPDLDFPDLRERRAGAW